MKYKVHKLDVRDSADVEGDLDRFINGLEGELISVTPVIVSHIGPSLHPESFTDYFLIVEKVAK
jgi:hypothetical protein